MSVRRTGAAVLVVVVLPAAYACSGAVHATEMRSGDQVVVEEAVDDDLVTAGGSVQVRAEVRGDVAAAGSQVTIAGPVNGYVMSAGRTVTLDGRIGNDLWAAGETVTIGSTIGDNLMAAGRTVHLRQGSVVGRDAQLAGETVTAEGSIARNLSIAAETARIGGEVEGTVEARAGSVVVLPGAVIRGDLVVQSPQPPDVSPQAQVLGEVRYEGSDEGGGWPTWPLFWLLCFFALLVLGLATVAFSPAWAARVSSTLRARVGASIVAGLIVVLGVPLAIGVLCITLIGIPLAGVLLGLYAVALLLSSIFVAYRIGDWLLGRFSRAGAKPWTRMAAGVLVVSILISLPALGWLMTLGVLITGAGALALERRDARRQA